MCLLHSAKLICENVILHNSDVKNVRHMFIHHRYPKQFFDAVVKKV